MASQIVGTAAYPQKPTNNQDYICGSIVLAIGWRLRFCFLAEPQKRGAAREPRWVRCQLSRRALRAWVRWCYDRSRRARHRDVKNAGEHLVGIAARNRSSGDRRWQASKSCPSVHTTGSSEKRAAGTGTIQTRSKPKLLVVR
jgi:hypothetical protein